MSSSILYRVDAVLLVLFALGHQLGFRRVDPRWGITDLIDRLKTTTFDVQGARRNFWGFFAGFGFFVTALLLFSAALAWEFGGLPAAVLESLRLVLWTFAGCYVIIAVLTWRYFFKAPLVFAVLVALGLMLAAWRASAGAV